MSLPEKLANFITFTRTEGPLALLIPEAVVTAGRSAEAASRGGFLEFQERLTEETAVGILWLGGVKTLRNAFKNHIEPWLFPGQSASSDVAWKNPWKNQFKNRSSVDLDEQELFTAGKKEMDQLLRKKMLRWGFSVGSTLFLVAYAIPKLNQMKTNWLISRRTRTQEGDNVQFGDPVDRGINTNTNTVPRQIAYQTPYFTQANAQLSSNYQTPPFRVSSTAAGQSLSGQSQLYTTLAQTPLKPPGFQANSQQQPSLLAPGFLTQYKMPLSYPQSGAMLPINSLGLPPQGFTPPQAPRFGLSLPRMAQAAGHLVEQNPYGSILVVDTAVVSGRGYMASKRSTDETVEVVFRDLASLYFYILSTPHMMKALGAVINRTMGTHLNVQPKVTNHIHDKLTAALREKAPLLSDDNYRTQINRVLLGEPAAVVEAAKPFGTQMQQANFNEFQQLLDLELNQYLGQSAGKARHSVNALFETVLKNKPGEMPTVSTKALASMLDELSSPAGKSLQTLTQAERTNIGVALKQAFRHTAGITVPLNSMDSLSNAIQPVLSQLPHPGGHADLFSRLAHQARLDSVNQLHTIMRRVLTVTRNESPERPPLESFKQAGALADFLAESVKRHQLPEALLKEKLSLLDATLPVLKDLQMVSTEESTADFSLGGLQSLKRKIEETLKPQQANKSAALTRTQKQALKKALHTLELPEKLFGSAMVNSKLAPPQALTPALQSVFGQFNAQTASSGGNALIQWYQQQANRLLSGEQGRLFSLATSETSPEHTAKLAEIFQGGLVNDRHLVAKASDTMGTLVTDPRLYTNTQDAIAIHQDIQKYCKALHTLVNKLPEAIKKPDYQMAMQRFKNLNNNLHCGVWGVALSTTLVCLGWLVPKMQMQITQWRTGKDINPGIASAQARIRKNTDDPL
ncbi:MAG: hypothetical protein AAGI66_09570 [Cyanobacteria bacterium P01_H01_bin.74]